MDADALLRGAIGSPGFRRATFGGTPRTGPCPWVRALVRPVMLRGRRHWQFNYYDAKKHVAKNADESDLAGRLDELLAFRFAGIHVETDEEAFDVRTTKKGQVTVGRKKVASPAAVEPHNRAKDVPLPEGKADHVLEAMGVLAADGTVKGGMRAKFAQINEFLKHLGHALADADLLNLGRELVILDCGCGSSYLTLAAHHWLNDVRNVPARLLGVDVNEEVIRKSAAKAHALNADDSLAFRLGRIAATDARPDVVLALHACDTATDDALAQAVNAGAKLILAAPCCHRHLNGQLAAAGVLRPVLRHGILRERTADIVTDAFRALLLRLAGYRTDVFEFVSHEHTARNVMIRAVRGAPPDAGLTAEYEAMTTFWGVTPYLAEVISDPKTRK